MQDETACVTKVNEMLAQAARDRRERQPSPPLIRLRVIYSGTWARVEPLNPIRLGQQFRERVANPADMFMVKVDRSAAATRNTDTDVNKTTMGDVARRQKTQLQSTVEDIVS